MDQTGQSPWRWPGAGAGQFGTDVARFV